MVLSDPKLVELLNGGGVGVIPTDTVYGLVCRADKEDAVERLYTLKNRERKPGTIIAASTDQLVALGLKARYLKAVEHYWPGPISIIIPCATVLGYLHQGIGSLAVRVSANKELNELLAQTGAIVTSSANPPGKPEATTVEEARAYFGDSVDFYVDGGDLSDREPSTVIRVVDDMIEVLRPGALKFNEAGEIVA